MPMKLLSFGIRRRIVRHNSINASEVRAASIFCPGGNTIHLQLVPRSRIRGSIHPLPPTSSWHNGQLIKHRDNFIFYVPPKRRLTIFQTTRRHIPQYSNIQRYHCENLSF
jgi:hypothetical protein